MYQPNIKTLENYNPLVQQIPSLNKSKKSDFTKEESKKYYTPYRTNSLKIIKPSGIKGESYGELIKTKLVGNPSAKYDPMKMIRKHKGVNLVGKEKQVSAFKRFVNILNNIGQFFKSKFDSVRSQFLGQKNSR